MIIKGYHDVNIKVNNNNSLFTFLKIEYSEKMEDYLFNKYMRSYSDRIEKDIKRLDPEYKVMKLSGILKLNSADRIRVDRFDEDSIKDNDIYEFVFGGWNNNRSSIRDFKNGKIDIEKMFQYEPEELRQLLLRKNLMIKSNEIILKPGVKKCNMCYNCLYNDKECNLYKLSYEIKKSPS